ncbi:MAG: glycosyltransferase, partial [Lachnospiraceae bacterium]|nr:glycosyltransferase [Lachnospiraceae bacterium]
MSDLITIIVPVYNGEKYIQKCLDSILQQTYDNYEILIVNDGSTDETLKIATQYEQKYENIRIVTKENQGLPQARKTGVENANGSYIGFVDVDDWIDPDMF